ncbi:TPA: phage tail length tape measure family protein [Stenotrophomonas maltophilia]|nr:phage tail length tape measure family protein [Stenotrophomonas maltophilia]
MTDIAELGYKIDSSGLVEGTKALDDNAAAADKAGAAAERLEKSQQGTGKSASFWANEQAKINARVQEMERIEQRTAAATKQAATATEARELNLQKLLGQINPTVAALNRLAEQEDRLSKARDLGLLKPQVWQQYQNQLDATRGSLLATSNGMGRLNLQTIEAQQSVAVLFRALATGNFAQVQSSITSLTARSGALSAMFSATGIAVAGLAVGLAAMVATTYSAQKEMDGYNAALLKAGNAAGFTSAGLRALANDIGKATGRYEDARKAVVALAESGRLSGQLLAQAAAAAVSLAQVSGQDVTAAAKQLEEIAKAPSKALIDLNSDYRFLTAAVLEHVQSLEQQGRQTEAVAYATAEAAEEFDRRAEQMKAQTASLTGMVAALRSEWQAFTQDLRNLNNPTLDINIAAVEQKLASLQSGVFVGPRYLLPGARDNDIAVLQEQLRVMRQQRQEQQDLATGDALVKQLQQDGLDGYIQINSVLDRAKTSTEKLEESTRKLKASYEALRISNPASELLKGVQFGANGGISGGSYDRALAQLVKDSQKGQKKPGRNGDDSAAQNMLAAAQRQIEANKQLVETGIKVTESERQAMAIEQVLAKSKNTMTASTRALLVAAREELLASGQKAAAYTKEEAAAEALARQQAILAQAGSNRDRANELDLLGMSGGSDGVAMLRRQLDIQREYQDELKRLGSRDVAKDKATWDLLAANADAFRSRELEKERAFQEQRLAMLGDWRLGVQVAWQNYAFDATNYNQQAQDAVQSTLSTTTSSIATQIDELIRGNQSLGDSFKNVAVDMGNAVIGALEQMAAQWLVYKAVQLAVGESTSSASANTLVGNAAATAAQAALAAYASTAAIPIVGPAMAPGAAQLALSATAPYVAAVAAAGAVGMAHDGIDSVPREGTWLLDKGERVLTAGTAAKMDATLDRIAASRAAGPGAGGNVYAPTINVNGDPDARTLAMVEQSVRRGMQQNYDRISSELTTGQGRVGKGLRRGNNVSRRVT